MISGRADGPGFSGAEKSGPEDGRDGFWEVGPMAGEAEKALDSLGLKLPEVGKPLGAYVNSVRTGNLLFVSGKFPKENGKLKYVGKVGREITEEQAQDAARLTALSCLAATKAAIE